MSGASADIAPGAVGDAAAGEVSWRFDAFISYAHSDREFAARLCAALKARGKSVWMDEEDIPGGARWRAQLERAIESADAFLFVVSPASAVSTECLLELEYAVGLNKRILPVRARATDPRVLPEALSEHQLIPARTVFGEDFDASLGLLIAAIESDPEWVQRHTEWGRRALEWDRHRRDRGFLLAGTELEAAEQWRREASGKTPAPTLLHGEFIDASRQAVTRRLRRTRGFVLIALLVAVGLAVLAFVQRQIAVSNQHTAVSNLHTAQSLQLAASAEATLGKDPELSTLLALQALRVRNTAQAVQALRNALPQLRALGTLRPGGILHSAAFSPDGKQIVTANADGAVRIWSVSSREQLAVLTSGSPLFSAAFSPDGKQILTASADGSARIWSASGHQQLAVLTALSGAPVYSAAFSPDGKQIVTASEDGTARIWSASGHQQLAVLTYPGGIYLNSAAFSPDGKQIVTASADGSARIWSARGHQQLAVLTEPGGSTLYSAAFSPDGKQIVTASDDGTARIWSARGHQQLAVLTEPGGSQLFSAAFSPDGKQIVTASADGSARIWSARDHQQLAVLTEPGGSGLNDAAFSPDGKQIVTASADSSARIWSTELAGSAQAVERIARMRVTRQLTPSERKTYLVGG
jgi:Tol biopolymer transport system component